jgi:hypothetical protein
MVFTRDAPQAGAERPGMLARLFRRGTGKDEAAAEDAVSASPLPKAAE